MLRTLEIVTSIRNPGYRPSCSCSTSSKMLRISLLSGYRPIKIGSVNFACKQSNWHLSILVLLNAGYIITRFLRAAHSRNRYRHSQSGLSPFLLMSVCSSHSDHALPASSHAWSLWMSLLYLIIPLVAFLGTVLYNWDIRVLRKSRGICRQQRRHIYGGFPRK